MEKLEAETIRERLNRNQEKLKEISDNILAQNLKIEIGRFDKIIKDKTAAAIHSITNGGDYSKAIDALQEARDASLGIIWQKSQSENGKDHYLVRDARYSSSNPGLHNDNIVSYQIAAINNARAAVRILEQELESLASLNDFDKLNKGKKVALKESINIINQDLNFCISNMQPKIREFNGRLLAILEANSITDVKNKIKFVKEVAQLEDIQYHVATITMQYDNNIILHNMVEVDTLILGLTDQQKKEYEAIQEDKDGPEWYKQAPDWMKPYVKKYSDQVSDKTLPTQLRQYPFSGLRNAYEKTTYIDGKEIQRNLHSASLSFHGKVDINSRIEVVKQNILQLIASQSKDQAIILTNLTSPPKGIGKLIEPKDIERGAYYDVKKALEELQKKGGALEDRKNVRSVSNPINFVRNYNLSITDQKAFDDTLKDIGSGLRDKQAIAQYLRTGKGLSSAKKELYSLSDFDEKTILQHAINTKQNINQTFFSAPLTWIYNSVKGIFFGKNQNAEVIVSMSALSDAIHRMDKPNILFKDSFKKTQVPIIEKFCASGKDRTGQHQEDGTAQAVTDYLKITDPDLKKQNQILQVSGEHQQLLAGINGGTQGSHGLKDGGYAGYHRLKSVQALDTSKTSSLNYFKYAQINENKKKALMNNINASVSKVKAVSGINPDTDILKEKQKSSIEVVPVTSKSNIARSVIQNKSSKSNLAQDVMENKSSKSNIVQSVIQNKSSKSNLAQDVMENKSPKSNVARSLIEEKSDKINILQR